MAFFSCVIMRVLKCLDTVLQMKECLPYRSFSPSMAQFDSFSALFSRHYLVCESLSSRQSFRGVNCLLHSHQRLADHILPSRLFLVAFEQWPLGFLSEIALQRHTVLWPDPSSHSLSSGGWLGVTPTLLFSLSPTLRIAKISHLPPTE